MAELVSDESFDEKVLKADRQTLVDFWAPWCGPCRALAPVIDEIAEQVKDIAYVYKMNVDESPKTAAKYGIRSIPTLILFRNGEAVDQRVGSVPDSKILEMFK